MEIRHLHHSGIEKEKWDLSITSAFNGIAYAYSWYLDIMCPGWEALVAGDYEIVMPLTAGVKYGFHYLYQPFFVQQLGVFSFGKPDTMTVGEFLRSIPPKYRFIEININFFNKAEGGGFSYSVNKNFLLDLKRPYEKIAGKYSDNAMRNIDKALKHGLTVYENAGTSEIVSMFRNTAGGSVKRITSRHYRKIETLINYCLANELGQILGCYTPEGILCAAVFLVTTHRRSIYILPCSTAEGKEKRAMFMLIDYYIKSNSGKNLVLDFEGSNIEGIARFFKGFGATACEYFTVKRNRLPFFIRLLKR